MRSISSVFLLVSMMAVLLWGCANKATLRHDLPPARGDSAEFASADSTETISPEAGESVSMAILMAGAMVERGDFQGALEQYVRALSLDPSNREVGSRYIGLALQMGRFGDALAGVDLMLESDPDDKELRLRKAQLLVMSGELEGAGPLTEALLDEFPEDPDVLRLRVQLLERQGEPLEAAELQARLLDTDPEDASLKMTRAALLMRGGSIEESKQILRELLDHDPSLEAAADLLVSQLQGEEKTDEAVLLLESLVARTPDLEVHRRALADLYLAAGREEEAATLLIPLARSGALDWHSQVLLTDLLVRVGNLEEAWGLAQGLLRGGENDSIVLQMVGEIAMEKGELEVAEELLERAHRGDLQNADILVSLLLARSRLYPELVGQEVSPEAGERKLEADTQERYDHLLTRASGMAAADDFRQNLLIGALLRRGNRNAEAVLHLKRATEVRPDNVQALYDLAWAQEEADLHRQACDTLDQLLLLRPDEAHLLNFYGYLLAEQGWQLERAEKMILRAVEAEPENPYYLDSLGWVLYQLGRYEEALDHLVSASNQLGDDVTILEHIGDTLTALQSYEKALSIYERANALGGDPERLSVRIEEVRRKVDEAP